ncbi:MAG: hypothetical protein ACRC6F_04120, partial [Aeromonas sp.]
MFEKADSDPLPNALFHYAHSQFFQKCSFKGKAHVSDSPSTQNECLRKLTLILCQMHFFIMHTASFTQNA